MTTYTHAYLTKTRNWLASPDALDSPHRLIREVEKALDEVERLRAIQRELDLSKELYSATLQALNDKRTQYCILENEIDRLSANLKTVTQMLATSLQYSQPVTPAESQAIAMLRQMTPDEVTTWLGRMYENYEMDQQRALKKPIIKREIAISRKLYNAKTIILSATKDAAEEIREFGDLAFYEKEGAYWLKVDPRFDFDEVVKYIEEYGQ